MTKEITIRDGLARYAANSSHIVTKHTVQTFTGAEAYKVYNSFMAPHNKPLLNIMATHSLTHPRYKEAQKKLVHIDPNINYIIHLITTNEHYSIYDTDIF